MSLSVTLFFVDITGANVDALYWACGDARTAGPFMSGGSAVDWSREFANDAAVFSRQGDEEGVCQPPALYKTMNGWERS